MVNPPVQAHEDDLEIEAGVPDSGTMPDDRQINIALPA